MDIKDKNTAFSEAVLEVSEQFKNAIVLLDIAEMKITYRNKKAMALTSAFSEFTESGYRQLLSRIPLEQKGYVESQISEMLRYKRSCEIEFSYYPADDGDERWLCCTIYFLTRSNQLFIHIADTTQSKSQENFLTEFSTKKNTLIETLTHHFSGALMLMQELTRQAEDASEHSGNQQLTHYLKLLSANTESCVAVMNNLLNEEHIKSTKIGVKMFRVDVVEKVSFIYQNLIAIPTRNITYDTVAPSIFVYTDEFKVLQIINNFVSNAIKFTTVEKPIAISIYQTEKNVIISVEDEGIGIPEHLQPFLFNKKSEAGRIGLSGEQSNGYGLYISKMLAQSMHASIEYETEENKGSIFYLLIPREITK